jgi:hypothetical protein
MDRSNTIRNLEQKNETKRGKRAWKLLHLTGKLVDNTTLAKEGDQR